MHILITNSMIAKIINALAGGAGASVSMAILVPHSLREAFARGFVGVMSACFGALPTIHRVGLADTTENIVLAAYGIGFAAWFVLGAVLRTLDAWRLAGAIKAITDVRGVVRNVPPKEEEDR